MVQLSALNKTSEFSHLNAILYRLIEETTLWIATERSAPWRNVSLSVESIFW